MMIILRDEDGCGEGEVGVGVDLVTHDGLQLASPAGATTPDTKTMMEVQRSPSLSADCFAHVARRFQATRGNGEDAQRPGVSRCRRRKHSS